MNTSRNVNNMKSSSFKKEMIMNRKTTLGF